ncbi:MAG: glycosyltransferase [Treponema sp.]|nr:glycosyltransferase [Treponema sp.]
MILFDFFCYGFSIFITAIHITLLTGVLLEKKREKKMLKRKTENIKISVIIPIHNESHRMKGLLRTLLLQNYHAEIIFLDDCSTDESLIMLEQFVNDASKLGILNCKIITLKENPGKYKKQYALSRGIAEAEGDYFLFTDGDCEVPPNWIQIMAQMINDGKTGVVTGPVFKKCEGKGFFFLYQCFDHAIRYNYIIGSIGIGAASGVYGNNFIVSRKAINNAGGYNSIPASPTEDAALISHIRRKSEYSIRAITFLDAAVDTESEKSWSSLIHQTLRWNNGGIFSPDLWSRFFYNIFILNISAGILVIPLLPFFPKLVLLPVAIFFSMILNSLSVYFLFRSKMPAGDISVKFGYIICLFFTPVYLTLMTVMSYLGIKPKWKNREL